MTKEDLLHEIQSLRISCNAFYQSMIDRIRELEKENAELKELIKNIIRVTWGEGWNYSLDWKVKAEQFLKDCDIDNAIQQANKGLDFDKIADEMEQDLKDSEVEK